MTDKVSEDAEALRKQVDSFQTNQWKKHKNAAHLSIAFTVLGVLLGAAVTAAGFFDLSKVAGVLGIAMTVLIGLNDAFNFSEKANFYAGIHAEGKALRDRLRYLVKSEQEFKDAFNEYQGLRLKSAQQAPKGKGISIASKGGEA